MPLSETEPLVAAPAMSERVSESLATSEAPTAAAAISAERTESVRMSLLVTAPSLILLVDTALAPMSAFITCPSTMSELRTVLAAYAVPAPRAMMRARNEHTFEKVSPRRIRADMRVPLTRAVLVRARLTLADSRCGAVCDHVNVGLVIAGQGLTQVIGAVLRRGTADRRASAQTIGAVHGALHRPTSTYSAH